MKKSLLLLTLFATLFFGSSHAQTSLTVADGMEANSYVPVYGYYADYYQRNQVIYPASMLTDMVGSGILSLTFYFYTAPSSNWSATFDVKLGVTSDSSFQSTAYVNVPTTTVYTGTLTKNSDNTLTVTLAEPYVYTGGNLLLEVTSQSGGNYYSAKFFGVSSSNGSIRGHNGSGISNITNQTRENFIPKTTFSYADMCKPANLDVSNVTGSSALVTWDNMNITEPLSYDFSYKAADATAWTEVSDIHEHSYFLTVLQPQTNYQVRVRAHCDAGDPSDYVTLSFSTECSGGYTDPVVIGNVTNPVTTYGIPFGLSYKYSYSQQIYTAEEIGGAKSINGISLQYFYAYPVTRNVDIYLGHTNKTGFSYSDWVPQSNLTLVYSGNVEFNNTGENFWLWIPFDTVFEYNGTDNLVVAFDDNTGSAPSYGNVFYSHSSGKLSIYVSNYSTDVDPNNLGSNGNPIWYRNNLRIPGQCITSDCDRANVLVTGVTNSTAQLQFTPGNGASGVELQYKRSQDDVFISVPVTGTTCELTGLVHNTEYTVRIRSLCGGSQSPWLERTFTTKASNYSRIYVNVGGTGDGASWAAATGDLGWALNTAAAIRSTYGTYPDVWIAYGTYYGDSVSASAFTLVDGVNVYGSFAGDETELSQRDLYAHPTILDGQNSQRVVEQLENFTVATVLDGVTLKNGKTTGNGGGALLKYNTYLYNSEIINNTAASGGGVYTTSSVIENCRFRGNWANGNNYNNGGGGMYTSYAMVMHCEFTHNRATKNGGGVYIDNSNSNYAALSNCLIANNTADVGGGIYNSSSYTLLENNTIVNNEAVSSGAGIRASYMYKIANCILWGNRTTAGAVSSIDDNGNVLTCTYSAVEDGYAGTNNVMILPDSVLGGLFAPKFVTPSATVGYLDATPYPNWRFLQGSVFANRGSNSLVTIYNNADLDFQSRVKHDTVDLGCYESDYYGHPLPAYGNIIYVTQNGGGSHDGSSWDNATGDLNLALGLAEMYNADVWVAEGVYYGDTMAISAFTMHDGVNVYGGFEGNEPETFDLSQRDLTAHVTALDGGNARRVLNQPGSFTHRTVWDGLTLRNGNYTGSTYGGGAANLKSNSTLSNCVITHNHADGYGGAIYGSGYHYGSNDTIFLINCTISYNSAGQHGGGVYLSQNISIQNCVITHNTAGNGNGGLRLSEGIITHSTITHNTAGTTCGGISSDRSKVYNCLIANNTSGSSASGILADRSDVFGCTIVNNASSGTGANLGAGLVGTTSTSASYLPNVVNCIIWGNRNNGEIANVLNNTACHHS
ncbi:MAG: fibronectin type III domain-containing protein, partial [Bacteroidales bacterium]|nr:fibronectin type III domain-containing protein [Bacteroidales bacterium]